jgi:transcription elongation factor
MLKVQIDLDINKIISENKYTQTALSATIDKAFSNRGMKVSIDFEKGRIIVTDSGRTDDYGNLWSVIWGLAEKSWFVDNLKQWLWFNNNEGDDSVEDILSFVRANKIGTLV